MNKPKFHIFVCTSSRINGQQKGYCHAKGGVDLVMKFTEEIEERGLGGEVFVNNTGCFGICEQGPVIVVYPGGIWYKGVTVDDVETIMEEHIEGSNVVSRLEI